MSPPRAVVGLEVHAQLRTATKLFCRCPNRAAAPPNTLTCAICLGHPGTLPRPNRHAVDLAVLLALALGARVAERSRWARKAYSYPDLPKGYQLTQHARPLATGGRLPLPGGGGLGIRRLHLEEDAARLLHDETGSGVDFNRAGVPLVEVVFAPELGSGREAREAFRQLHLLLVTLGVSEGRLEEGSVRCDANVSLAAERARGGGARVEIKNLASFRQLARAVDAEIARQRRMRAEGGTVAPETRGFDEAAGATFPLRDKESAAEYRYQPEPDLPPLAVPAERREELAERMPELPWERRERLTVELGLTPGDAERLAADPRLAEWFEAAVAAARRQDAAGSGRGRAPATSAAALAAWVLGPVRRLEKETGLPAAEALPPARLARLVALVARGAVSDAAGRDLLASLWGGDEEPEQAVARRGLAAVGDATALAAWAAAAVADHPDLAARYRGGRRQLLGFFVGEAMHRSGGRAEPRRLRQAVEDALAAEEPAAEGTAAARR